MLPTALARTQNGSSASLQASGASERLPMSVAASGSAELDASVVLPGHFDARAEQGDVAMTDACADQQPQLEQGSVKACPTGSQQEAQRVPAPDTAASTALANTGDVPHSKVTSAGIPHSPSLRRKRPLSALFQSTASEPLTVIAAASGLHQRSLSAVAQMTTSSEGAAAKVSKADSDQGLPQTDTRDSQAVAVEQRAQGVSVAEPSSPDKLSASTQASAQAHALHAASAQKEHVADIKTTTATDVAGVPCAAPMDMSPGADRSRHSALQPGPEPAAAAPADAALGAGGHGAGDGPRPPTCAWPAPHAPPHASQAAAQPVQVHGQALRQDMSAPYGQYVTVDAGTMPREPQTTIAEDNTGNGVDGDGGQPRNLPIFRGTPLSDAQAAALTARMRQMTHHAPPPPQRTGSQQVYAPIPQYAPIVEPPTRLQLPPPIPVSGCPTFAGVWATRGAVGQYAGITSGAAVMAHLQRRWSRGCTVATAGDAAGAVGAREEQACGVRGLQSAMFGSGGSDGWPGGSGELDLWDVACGLGAGQNTAATGYAAPTGPTNPTTDGGDDMNHMFRMLAGDDNPLFAAHAAGAAHIAHAGAPLPMQPRGTMDSLELVAAALAAGRGGGGGAHGAGDGGVGHAGLAPNMRCISERGQYGYGQGDAHHPDTPCSAPHSGPFNPAPGQHGDNHGRERLLDALEASELIQPTSRSHTPAHPTLMGNAHAAQQQQRVHAGMCMAPAGVEGGERALSAAARRSPALPQGQFAMPPARPQHDMNTPMPPHRGPDMTPTPPPPSRPPPHPSHPAPQPVTGRMSDVSLNRSTSDVTPLRPKPDTNTTNTCVTHTGRVLPRTQSEAAARTAEGSDPSQAPLPVPPPSWANDQRGPQSDGMGSGLHRQGTGSNMEWEAQQAHHAQQQQQQQQEWSRGQAFASWQAARAFASGRPLSDAPCGAGGGMLSRPVFALEPAGAPEDAEGDDHAHGNTHSGHMGNTGHAVHAGDVYARDRPMQPHASLPPTWFSGRVADNTHDPHNTGNRLSGVPMGHAQVSSGRLISFVNTGGEAHGQGHQQVSTMVQQSSLHPGSHMLTINSLTGTGSVGGYGVGMVQSQSQPQLQQQQQGQHSYAVVAAVAELQRGAGVLRGVPATSQLPPRAPTQPRYEPTHSRPSLHGQLSLPAYGSHGAAAQHGQPAVTAEDAAMVRQLQAAAYRRVTPTFNSQLIATRSLPSYAQGAQYATDNNANAYNRGRMVVSGVPVERADSAASAGRGGMGHAHMAGSQGRAPSTPRTSDMHRDLERAVEAAAIAAASVAAAAGNSAPSGGAGGSDQMPDLSFFQALQAEVLQDRQGATAAAVRAGTHTVATAQPAAAAREPVAGTRRKASVGADGAGGGDGATTKKCRENLPRQSVTQLKMWMYEHIFHPYPTEPEKSALLQQTGLDLLQLNNWFINGRVRIWRPIVTSVFQQHYPRLLETAQRQRDKLAEDKLLEAVRNQPAQIALLLADEASRASLQQEARRAAQDLQEKEAARAQGKANKKSRGKDANKGGAGNNNKGGAVAVKKE